MQYAETVRRLHALQDPEAVQGVAHDPPSVTETRVEPWAAESGSRDARGTPVRRKKMIRPGGIEYGPGRSRHDRRGGRGRETEKDVE